MKNPSLLNRPRMKNFRILSRFDFLQRSSICLVRSRSFKTDYTIPVFVLLKLKLLNLEFVRSEVLIIIFSNLWSLVLQVRTLFQITISIFISGAYICWTIVPNTRFQIRNGQFFTLLPRNVMEGFFTLRATLDTCPDR